MAADATAPLAQRPELHVVLLADGAPEMRDLLRAAVGEAALGVSVTELLDFWHLVEKLAPAALVVYGAEAGAAMVRWRADLLNRPDTPEAIHQALITSGRRDVRVGDARLVHDLACSSRSGRSRRSVGYRTMHTRRAR